MIAVIVRLIRSSTKRNFFMHIQYTQSLSSHFSMCSEILREIDDSAFFNYFAMNFKHAIGRSKDVSGSPILNHSSCLIMENFLNDKTQFVIELVDN